MSNNKKYNKELEEFVLDTLVALLEDQMGKKFDRVEIKEHEDKTA